MDESEDIRATNISMVFERGSEKLLVLNSVNITVTRGKLLAIVGPSGCGKTTLIKILAKLLEPTRGEVWHDPDQLRDGIAYIPQSSLLFPWRTLFQNASLGMEIKGALSKGKVERIQSEIYDFGLNGFEESMTSELSGGMLQRVALIRALESQPKLLFCDEPFSAIDFVSRLEMNTEFKYRCRIKKITTVFVTHNIEEAIFLGDEVVVMGRHPGRVIKKYTRPHLSVGSEDAVDCKQAPEFGQRFKEIWKDIENGGA